MKTLRKLIKPLLILSGFILLVLIVANVVVNKQSKKFVFCKVSELPECYTAIVPGARVSPEGVPSDYLQDRLDKALELYRIHKVTRFLLSGDHGRKSYDEVNSMKAYLTGHGIPVENIFLDHAGFDTYNTMTRAREVFQVKDAIIVTQEFHLPRAVFIARNKGIDAYGIKADKREYAALQSLKIRETIAKVKAFTEVIINKSPKFLGNQIPITGDSRLSYD